MARLAGLVEAEVHIYKLPIDGLSGSANVFASLKNPFGNDVWVIGAALYVKTIATAAATLDIGIAADATTSNDTLFDGLDVHSAGGWFDNRRSPGSNGLPMKLWKADEYLNIKEASGNVNGLVSDLFVAFALMTPRN